MIVVTIELWPHGRHDRAVLLGSATIANDGTGTLDSGNYEVTLSRRGNATSLWKLGRVEGFPRKRLGGYDLLFRALREIVGGRNP